MLSSSEKLFVGGLVLLLVLNQLLFGANRNDIALAFAVVYGLGLLAVLGACGWARSTIVTSRLFGLPALLMTATIAAALLSLTSLAPQEPHGAWRDIAASPAAAIDRAAVMTAVAKLLGLACAFALGLLCGARLERAGFFLKILCGAVALYALGAIAFFIIQPGSALGVETNHDDRLTATFLSANSAAAFLGTALVASLAAVIGSGPGASSLERGWRLAVVTLLAAALVLTAGRSAIAATVVGAAVFVGWTWFVRRGERRLDRQLVVGVVVLGIAAVALRDGLLGDRLAVIDQDIGTRRDIWLAHWQAFQAAPWQGYGLGSFDAVNKLIQTDANYDVLWRIRATHNVYLQWLEEAGLLGAIPMFLCVGVILTAIVLKALGRGPPATLARVVFSASLVFLLHGITDFSLQVPSIASFWAVLLGLAYGAPSAGRRQALEEAAGREEDGGPQAAGGDSRKEQGLVG